MFDKLKREWRELKMAQSGHRFVECYERHQAREAPWLKPVLFFLAVFSLVIGVVLAFVPGPAILFFAISGALLACESRTVATAFDRLENWGRRKFERLRAPRRKRNARATTKALSPKAAAVIAARAEKAQRQQSDAKHKTRRDVQLPAARRHADSPAQEQPSAPQPEQSDIAPPVDMSKLHVSFEAAEYARGMEERDETAPQKPATAVQGAPIAAVHTLQMPKVRKAVRVIETREIGTRTEAPRMQALQRVAMPRVPGTVKLWRADMPKPQLAAQSTPPRPERPATQGPAIVTLPPPKMVGERPKRASAKIAPIGERRATPPPAPRSEEHRRSRA